MPISRSMVSWNGGLRGVCVATTAAGIAISLPRQCPASGIELESIGVRGGVSDNANFSQVEALADWKLPWRWDWTTDWHLQTKLNCSLGWLGAEHRSAAIGTAGPGLLLNYDQVPINLEGGSSFTLLSRDTFGSRDLGSIVQFTSYVGLNWDITQHIRLGYRFSHMSNAGIDSQHNEGLNMHMLALSYLF